MESIRDRDNRTALYNSRLAEIPANVLDAKQGKPKGFQLRVLCFTNNGENIMNKSLNDVLKDIASGQSLAELERELHLDSHNDDDTIKITPKGLQYVSHHRGGYQYFNFIN